MKLSKQMHGLALKALIVLPSILIGIYSPPARSQPFNPNCGILSTLALAEMQDQPASAQAIERLSEEYPQSSVSLADVKKMTALLRLSTLGVKVSLDELVQRQCPAIIHLTNPEHFVLLLDGSRQSLRLLESPASTVTVAPRTEIEQRFGGYALIVQTSVKEAPQIHLEETDYQFGIAGVGQKIEHDYKFTNIGVQPLTVSISGSSCGCTAALFDRDPNSLATEGSLQELVLQPGASSIVRVFYSVQSAGNVQQTVTLKTNDPVRPIIYLTIRGTVPQDLQVAPQTLLLNTSKGQVIRKEVQIIGPPSMNVTQVSSNDPTLKITSTIVSSDAVRKVWRVNVVRPATTAVGETKAVLTIKTTHPERPTITVPITVEVQGNLQVTPPAAFFGFVKRQESKQIVLTVQSKTGLPFKITGASVDVGAPGSVRVEGLTQDLAAQHSLTLKLDTERARFVSGRLTLKTNVTGEETLIIPITAYVETATSSIAQIRPDVMPGVQESIQLPRAEDDSNNVIGVAAPTVETGKPAPDFTATDTSGKVWKLSEFKGKKNLLLTFFPKCFTGGCANHLSSLRDLQADFDVADTQILAVSVDPAEGERGQKAFATQWKFLFPLIPDTQRKLSMLYGAAQNDKQLAARMSVLVDKTGVVRWIDSDVHVETHGADVLAKRRELGMAK